MTREVLFGTAMLKRIAAYAESHGIGAADALAVANLTIDSLDDPETFASAERLAKIYAYVAEHLEDPTLGLSLARSSATREYGVIGYIVANSPNLDEGYATVCRYSSALLSPAKIDYERRGPRVVMRLNLPARGRGIDLVAQDLIAAIFYAGQDATGEQWTAQSVQFSMPSDQPDAVSGFFGCKVGWDAPCSGVLQLRATDVRREMPGADPDLLQHLLEAVESQVARLRRARGELTRMMHLRGCIVDLEEGMVRRGPKTYSLTTKERALLEYFRQRANQVVTHADLERDLWGIGRTVISHAPAVAVRRLRQKIEPPSERPINLVTVFGEGWRLNLPTPKAYDAAS